MFAPIKALLHSFRLPVILPTIEQEEHALAAAQRRARLTRH